MKSNPEKSKPERERQDWGIVLIILLLGFLCVILSAQWALRFSPSWQVDADMGSNIDLNREFLANKPAGFIEPVDPDILTQPGWANFLTPGAKVVTRTPLPAGQAKVVPTQAQETAVAPVTNTIPVFTNTIAPTNTLVWLPLPATATRKPKEPPADTPTNTPFPNVDLRMSMTDGGGSYIPNGILIYTVDVTNTSAVVVNSVPVQFTLPGGSTNPSWSCSPAGGATCGLGGPGLNDTVNLPANASVRYTVTADAPGGGGTLNASALVTTPAGYNDTAPLNNMAAESTPALTSEINEGPKDDIWTNVGSGNSITILLDTPITSDFIYYERFAPGFTDRIDLDWVQIQISDDGISWYQVFYWGDPPPPGTSDANTNVASAAVTFCPSGGEDDNCRILSGLYNVTGITIDIASLGLSGSYPWVRINCPDENPFFPPDGCDIDAIEP